MSKYKTNFHALPTGYLLFSTTCDGKGVKYVIPLAKEHPADAAAGKRLFSIDAYQETGLNSAGQRTQTHFTYAFFNGQPTYDVVREKFLEIAEGKAKPISSRTGLVVQ